MSTDESRAGSGIVGLDEVLGGGLRRGQIYFVRGGQGTGKTTLALQFLIAGLAAGERGLYLSFGESPQDLMRIAHSHGWSLERAALQRIGARPAGEAGQYTLFPSSEVELHGLVQDVLDAVAAERPERLVIDPVSALRWYASDPYEYRRTVEALGQALAARGCTSLLLDAADAGEHAWAVAEGVIELAGPSGGRCSSLRIAKARAVSATSTAHDYRIATGGMQVFPRLDPVAPMARERSGAPLAAGGFSELLGGGLPWGATVLLSGPVASGKSMIAASLAVAAMEQGDQALYLSLAESAEGIAGRCGRKLAAHLDAGRLLLQEVDPHEVSPGELAHRVRTVAEALSGRLALVVLDAVDEHYAACWPADVEASVHRLCTYLNRRGVITVLIAGRGVRPFCDVALRTHVIDAHRVPRRGVRVVRHRFFDHDPVLHELLLTEDGIAVGAPLGMA